ncbi:MAG TPA: twin-arginine translocase subunit TatC [Porticoccaceae bacterium]|nr:twin-arginine translocase subunit TatC [Porticoccaceae bacterium]
MSEENPSENKNLSLVEHLIELRDRILRVLVLILVLFVCMFPFANEIYGFVSQPLRAFLPESSTMIATQVASPFLTPFKLTLVLAIFAGMPVILYQTWAFIAPGLYKKERRIVLPLFASSVLLFYAGMAFAYFVVFPLAFRFFNAVSPENVAVMTDISSYLDFVLKLFFAFGIAFEIPIATILLIWTGIVTPQSLAGKRPYVVVFCFVFGMLLTPPDIISQTLLALPMWFLYEVGLFFGRLIYREGSLDPESEATEQNTDNPAQDQSR